MKRFRNIAVGLVVIGFSLVLSICTYYNINMKKVSDDDTLKQVEIKSGTIESIAYTLKSNNLIKNVGIFKVYTRLTGKNNLKAGIYNFSENMGVKEITEILENGSNYNPNEITLTFKEGNNIRKIANIISENTINSYDDVIKTLNDKTYLDSLIAKYWFLTDDIKNDGIYYSLEGYLFPDTYRFRSKNVTVKDIIKKMLDEEDKKLSIYKEDIEKSNLSIHEIITLASIVELEGAKASDREKVAGVFYNRLNSNSYPTLGSDATTYYASKIDDWKVSLTYKELNDCSNKYNTRCNKNTGLPVGPICNPSVESIKATLHPDKNDSYYFVADCKGNVYLTKTSVEHNNIINKLKRENNWCA